MKEYGYIQRPLYPEACRYGIKPFPPVKFIVITGINNIKTSNPKVTPSISSTGARSKRPAMAIQLPRGAKPRAAPNQR